MSTISPLLSLGSRTLDSIGSTIETTAPTQAKLTTDQQMEQMSSSGHSASEIASALGVPVSEVDSVLDISPEADAMQAVAASRGLHISVKA